MRVGQHWEYGLENEKLAKRYCFWLLILKLNFEAWFWSSISKLNFEASFWSFYRKCQRSLLNAVVFGYWSKRPQLIPKHIKYIRFRSTLVPKGGSPVEYIDSVLDPLPTVVLDKFGYDFFRLFSLFWTLKSTVSAPGERARARAKHDP